MLDEIISIAEVSNILGEKRRYQIPSTSNASLLIHLLRLNIVFFCFLLLNGGFLVLLVLRN